MGNRIRVDWGILLIITIFVGDLLLIAWAAIEMIK